MIGAEESQGEICELGIGEADPRDDILTFSISCPDFLELGSIPCRVGINYKKNQVTFYRRTPIKVYEIVIDAISSKV